METCYGISPRCHSPTGLGSFHSQSSVSAIRSVFTVHCLNCKIKSHEISVDRPWEKNVTCHYNRPYGTHVHVLHSSILSP